MVTGELRGGGGNQLISRLSSCHRTVTLFGDVGTLSPAISGNIVESLKYAVTNELKQ